MVGHLCVTRPTNHKRKNKKVKLEQNPTGLYLPRHKSVKSSMPVCFKEIVNSEI